MRALAAIDLSIAPGERVAFIGPSGAGKTSLLRLLATHLPLSQGRLELSGEDPWSLGAAAQRRLRTRIGFIQQSPPLPPRQRVVIAVSAGRLGSWPLGKSLLNLLFPLDSAGVCATLERLDLADKLFQRCDRLSGGQLQRVGIARTLYQAPDLILADEPVSAMDPTLAAHTLTVLNRDAENRGATMLASLHAVNLALEQFPRIVGIRDGRIAFDRPAAQVTDADLEALYASQQRRSPDLPSIPVVPRSSRAPLC